LSYQVLKISAEEKETLCRRFLKTPETVSLASDPKFFATVVSLGLHQEIGTVHDELSVFLFDARTGEKIPRECLRSELISYHDHTGVRIWAEGHDRLDPRVRGMRTLLHPEFSHVEDGHIFQLVLLPEVIAKIAALEGVELVSVKSWGINTVFGGFDPGRSYYEGSMWEFVNIDAVKYAELLQNRQIVFWGTHDLVSHIAGIKSKAWGELQARGEAAKNLFKDYFSEAKKPVPFSLVLPYALGMLLDDLAQPMNYQSESRKHVVGLLTEAIRLRKTDTKSRVYLMKYPTSFEKLITLARADDPEQTAKCEGVLADLISELYSHALIAV
jgi:hypothetical protein